VYNAASLPRFDSPSIFGRLLDWRRGGYLRVAPLRGCTPSRAYRTDSNVVETTWIGDREQALVIDFMPLHSEPGPSTPPSLRLVRMIQPVRGNLHWRIDFHPAFDYGRGRSTVALPAPGVAVARRGGARLVLEYPARFRASMVSNGVRLSGSVEVGQTAVIALHHNPPARPRRIVTWDLATRLLDETDDYWRSWLRQCAYRGRYAPLVRRSALLLKLLQADGVLARERAMSMTVFEAFGGPAGFDHAIACLVPLSECLSQCFSNRSTS